MDHLEPAIQLAFAVLPQSPAFSSHAKALRYHSERRADAAETGRPGYDPRDLLKLQP